MSRKIAEERIRILFAEAKKRPEKAERYLKLAEKIGMKTQVPIPSDLRKKYCSNCYTYLTQGENCRVRINSKKGHITYTCKECGSMKRHGYK